GITYSDTQYKEAVRKCGLRVHPGNISAAIAVGLYMGVDIGDCVKAVCSFTPPELRSEITERNGITYFVDCYNANPDSMLFSIYEAKKQKNRKRHIAVFADMLELGDEAEGLHVETGYIAAEAGYDYLFAIGDFASCYAEGFLNFSSKNDAVFVYNKNEAEILKNDLEKFVRKGDLVLVKGSRGMYLEKVLKE
ncbi:MAG: hypothetical protein JXA66_05305, partial [Oligoflexia bacterium]|nr:hypothetical protein [Oligoflexia bacterium]